MAAPSLTYTLTNGQTADASQVMQDFNDLLNGITDGTKDLSISALTCAGTVTLNGNVNIGNAAGDDLVVTASLASDLPIKTTNTYKIGSSTKGLLGVYWGTGDTDTVLVNAADLTASRNYTLPDAGADTSFLMAAGAQTITGVKTLSAVIDGSSSSGGFKVETTRASPVSGDSQNVYCGTYTPTYGRTGATFTVQTHYWMRVGNVVYVYGYADMTAGGTTADCTITLPIAPSAFSATTAVARSQGSGVCHKDSGTAWLSGNPGATNAIIDGTLLANAANGLRVCFSYRLS